MNLFVNFIIISIIEDITLVAIGVCVGLVSFLIFEIFRIYKKIRKINTVIDKLQSENVRFKHDIDVIVNNANFDKEFIEHITNKIGRVNDIFGF